jgi:serine/threonine protein kinase/Flp pilus assembly protein TadD
MAEPQTKSNPTVPRASDLSGTTVGRFVIRNRLGAGGMGEVYCAEDTRLKRLVALKRISPAIHNNPHSRRRLWQEAECVSRLNDPHIAAIFDVFENGDDIFLVMEYVEGQTLRRRLQQPLSPAEFLEIALQCASALTAAHKGGVLHRDIKPENIMLTPGGEVKVLDFGLARALLREEGGTTLETATNSRFVGTFAYMSPETLLEKATDARADIFSLGVVFYEALAGRHPFKVKSGGFLETYERILHEDPAPLRQLNPEVPSELERIVAKMLAKDPGDRYAAAADLATDLRALRRSSVAPAVPQSPVRSKWFFRTALGILAALAVVALAATIPSVQQRAKSWLNIGTVPRQKQLAVLEFQAVEGSPEEASFTAGLTDTVTTKLTQLTNDRSLQVVPAQEVQAQHVTTAEQAFHDFGVNLVLEGSLHKAGDLVRVNYALVDARNRRQLSAQSVTLPASDPFAVQDQIVNGAVSMLGLEIPSSQRQALESHGTEVPGAYTLYLQGRGYLQNYDKPDNVDLAINLFQQAIQLDPRYALAYASLGEAFWKRFLNTHEPRLVESARGPCEQALRLDATLPAAHQCLGTVAAGTGHSEYAVLEFERVLGSEPTNDAAYSGLAHAYELLGKPAEAEKTYRRAIELRPQYWGGYNWLGGFYFRQMRYGQAVEMYSKVVALVPDSVHGHDNLGAAYLAEGRYPDAIETFQHSISLRPNAYAYSNLGTAYFYLRRFDEAAADYEQSLKLNDGDYEVWWNLGDAYYWNPKRNPQAEHAYRQCVSLGSGQLKVNPRDVYPLGVLAICSAMLNDQDSATSYLRRGLALSPSDAELSFKAALVYNHAGDPERALEWLNKALTAGYSPSLARDTPVLDSLRTNPKFQALFHPK